LTATLPPGSTRARIFLAGAVGERLAFGNVDRRSSRSDRAAADRSCFAETGTIEATDELLATVRSEVRALLVEHWSDVERVARLLIDRGSLTAEDLDGIFSPSIGPPPEVT
jgi:hypothetical protein